MRLLPCSPPCAFVPVGTAQATPGINVAGVPAQANAAGLNSGAKYARYFMPWSDAEPQKGVLVPSTSVAR
jgi:hypothetical protein